MMQQDFLWDQMRDETLSDKARKHAKQSSQHERAWDNACQMKHMRGK
jgi:hypothetical protein